MPLFTLFYGPQYLIHQLTITTQNDTNEWSLNLFLLRKELRSFQESSQFLIFNIIGIKEDPIAKSTVLITTLVQDLVPDNYQKCLQNGC